MSATCLRIAFLALLLSAAGCADPKCDTCGNQPPCPFTDRSTPSRTLARLICTHEERACAEYAALLADDYQFVFEATPGGLAIANTLTRLDDSTNTCFIFHDEKVKGVVFSLAYGSDIPDPRSGHAGWRKIEVTDSFIEIDAQYADTDSTYALRLDGGPIDVFFRRGRTPADTLASSATSKLWYVVEWQDHGNLKQRFWYWPPR